ncbi:MAG: UDP-2,4-diacetamido-2,4,6-trideoxy-beta-L-altropyranose hydrolase [Burkholderiales bacterium]
MIAIRVDASRDIGTGHLKRCLALAEALAERGVEARLVCRRLDDTAPRLLASTALRVHWLVPPEAQRKVAAADDLPFHASWAKVDWENDASEVAACLGRSQPEWLVIDHYAFDARWHDRVRSALDCRIAVVDDLADRPLDCDLLVDQNWHADHQEKYRRWLQRGPEILGGPRYALLGRGYRQAPKYEFSDVVRSIGIFMGGADIGGFSEAMLGACAQIAGFAGPISVVSTSANPHLERLARSVRRRPATRLELDLPDLSRFYAQHDLQVGAGGSATWERCCIGVPSLVLVVAQNQRQVVEPLEHQGILRMIKDVGKDVVSLGGAVRALIDDAPARRRMAMLARTLVDGEGASRVAERLAA